MIIMSGIYSIESVLLEKNRLPHGKYSDTEPKIH